MKQIRLTLIALLLVNFTFSQNLYPKKLNNCVTDHFCLDCGDQKADVDKIAFNNLIQELNNSCKLDGLNGKIIFQVLLDSTGKGCVLSHTDVSNNSVTKKIVKALNAFEGYIPAITDNKTEGRTSFDIVFIISNNNLKAFVKRVDINAFEKSFDRPHDPIVSNKKYVYENSNLQNYNIQYWNSSNSNLPNNKNDNVMVDDSLVWVKVNEGLAVFDGNSFKSIEKNIPTQSKYIQVFSMDNDNNGTKWIVTHEGLYSYNLSGWVKYDSIITGISKAYDVINNTKTNELFFCTNNGLTIFKDGKWSALNAKTLNDFPFRKIHYAKRDSKNRIWIGTFDGSMMIDENGLITNFENESSIFKGKCILSMDEDENGNIYFALYKNGKTDSKTTNFDEGLGIRYADGTYKLLSIDNSGIPNNSINQVLYDKYEKVLWISSYNCGLIRFDLNTGWENYHNLNSKMPTSDVWQMDIDLKGILYLATRQGLVKIEKLK